MAKSRRITAAVSVKVPQTREEAAAFLRQIGEKQRWIDKHELTLKTRSARLKEDFELAKAPYDADIKALTEGLRNWCDANRNVLTNGDKTKTVDLGTGKVSWEWGDPVCEVKNVAAILDLLKERDLSRFIRTKEEIDKVALKREPDVAATIPGVTIKPAVENFTAKPFEVELSGVAA